MLPVVPLGPNTMPLRSRPAASGELLWSLSVLPPTALDHTDVSLLPRKSSVCRDRLISIDLELGFLSWMLSFM